MPGRYNIHLSLVARIALVASLVVFVVGATLAAYRYYNRPVTLTVAVGTLDGEAYRAAKLIASQLAGKRSAVRLQVVDADDVRGASAMFAAGKVDLAVVRADVGDHARARSVAVIAKSVAMILTPRGSAITTVAGLRGHTLGVVGAAINQNLIDTIRSEYNLGPLKIEDIPLGELRDRTAARNVDAVLLVLPLTAQYVGLAKSVFQRGPADLPRIVPIDAAGAIAEVNGAYESFDIPKGTLRGSPANPEDDVTTLQTAYSLVAGKDIDNDTIASLTAELMSARNDLVSKRPGMAEMNAPDLDPNAFIPVHAGAAEYYNDTRQSFMDKYGDAIYITPMALGALVSILAAAWRFLGSGPPVDAPVVTSVYALPRRIRSAGDLAELAKIEDDIDALVKAELERRASGDSEALDVAALSAIAQRLEYLIEHRRAQIGTGQAG